MTSLFLSPALEQHQYIYWSLSRMASEKKRSHCYSLVWSIVCDCGGLGQSVYALNDMWLCDTITKLWNRVLFLVTVLSVQLSLYVNSLDDNLVLC